MEHESIVKLVKRYVKSGKIDGILSAYSKDFAFTGVKHLIFTESFNEEVKLPKGLKSIYLGRKFNHPLTLPAGLLFLFIGSKQFNYPLSLPVSLKHLILQDCVSFNLPLKLPPNIVDVKVSQYYEQKIVLPDSVLVAHIYGNVESVLLDDYANINELVIRPSTELFTYGEYPVLKKHKIIIDDIECDIIRKDFVASPLEEKMYLDV